VTKDLNNRYSCAKSFFLNKKSRDKILGKRKFEEYQYSIFFKKVGLGLLPFSRKKAARSLILRNRFFGYRRQQRKLKKKAVRFNRKLKYSFFFLSFRKKKYKRRSSKSSSRKFFTNIWLVAFIFTRPIRIKKVWYTKLLTRRVLSFFCTNFW
jgi:exopolyphosphatase/pppGpp-phosphohydrolase